MLVPTVSPPDGVTSNFVNPESSANQLVACSLVCISFTSLFVWGRMYAKSSLMGNQSWGWDDGKNLLSLFVLIIYPNIFFQAACIFAAVRNASIGFSPSTNHARPAVWDMSSFVFSVSSASPGVTSSANTTYRNSYRSYWNSHGMAQLLTM